MTGSLEMEEKKLSSDAYQWAYDRYIKGDPEMEKYFEELGVKADIARQLYNLRNQGGLSRGQLADLVGTTESVIEDIEEADYDGDFLAMASRIATALHRRVEVRLVPVEDIQSTGIFRVASIVQRVSSPTTMSHLTSPPISVGQSFGDVSHHSKIYRIRNSHGFASRS